MDWPALLTLGLAAFAGALVQAITGFGFAIVAAPVFLAVMSSTAAIPLLAALHVVQSAQLVPGLWRETSRPHLRRLILAGMIGCPIGVWGLQSLDVRTLKVVIGVVILAATGLFILRDRGLFGGAGDGSAGEAPPRPLPIYTTGLLSGAMTALLVMPGPPLMIYLVGQRLPKQAARALSLTFFAACYVAVTALNLAVGTLPASAWLTIAMLAPAVVAGTLLGTRLAARLPEQRFRVALLALLVLSGVGAIVSALGG